MTNREILGELKQCWEYITDIKDNQDGQLSKDEYNTLYDIRNGLVYVYEGLYNSIMKNNKEELRIKGLEDNENERVYISSDISGDYENYNFDTGERDWFACGDVDYTWYKDDDFLNYYNEESDN